MAITGICYKYNKSFTREEDEIIRNNWKEFAEEYNIPFDQAIKFAGVGDYEKEYVCRGLAKILAVI